MGVVDVRNARLITYDGGSLIKPMIDAELAYVASLGHQFEFKHGLVTSVNRARQKQEICGREWTHGRSLNCDSPAVWDEMLRLRRGTLHYERSS